jgi:multiple antibiotic resistance protein
MAPIDTSSVGFFVQAAIAMLVITAPPDPGKILLFNSQLQEDTKAARNAAALRLAIICFAILAATALIGREFIELLGINLGAFGVAGGLVVAGMGFEMLYGGEPSRAQGETKEAKPAGSDGLLVPLAIPLIAGPGAITTMITVTAADDSGTALIAGVVAAAAVAVAVYMSFAWLGGVIAKASPKVISVALRLGGLLLATIGIQLLLGGIVNYFEISLGG